MKKLAVLATPNYVEFFVLPIVFCRVKKMIDNHGQRRWADVIPRLRCPACETCHFADDWPNGLLCQHCDHRVPASSDGLIVFKEQLNGNNRIAAEFYNSQRWDRYRFWKWFTPFNDRAVTEWSAEVLELLPDLSGTRLLDVAIGDGRNLPFLPEDCEVYGVDISVAQLAACRQKYPRRELFLLQGESESLPFPDDTFDNVLSFGAFNYFNDPLKSLQEMARVVKPEGLVVVTDEYADLPDRMLGYKLGWPALDRWIMSRFLHLGDEFTEMIEEHRELKIEPIVDQVLTDWTAKEVCKGWAYCFVGSPNKT